MNCILCEPDNDEVVIWQNDRVRVIWVEEESDYPGFCRVIWRAHCRELSDLSIDDWAYCMQVVRCVEMQIRQVMMPDKMNVASLGNQVQHLHWHLIPRYVDDRHFPYPIWAAAVRDGVPDSVLKARYDRKPQLIHQIQVACAML